MLIETAGDNSNEGMVVAVDETTAPVVVVVLVIIIIAVVGFGAIWRYIFKLAVGVEAAISFRSLIVPADPVGITTVVLTIGNTGIGFGFTIVDGPFIVCCWYDDITLLLTTQFRNGCFRNYNNFFALL